MRPQNDYGMADYADYLRDESIVAELRNEAEELRNELRRVMSHRDAWHFEDLEECDAFRFWWRESHRRLEELQRELRFLAA